ncbi:probable methionine--tRNA ligase isoform X1 [Coffea arabica]|uniref:methionine--tRNA ligase n=2 Tax=Coffea arabica TaxID=13443 RepID=A0A6P6WNJ6_COFAR|nr:probable methionine--tRNA ligase isoform X1 [Coffea arabica]
MGDLENSGKNNPPQNVKLPIPGKRNILITSALPYVNNVPHLGNIIGCVLSADVFARYCRLRGYNVIYICGTDEYGTATENKALEEGVTPQEICDKYHAIHKSIYEWFDISFDKFGRTSSPEQTKVCQAIFKKLLENNWLSENTMQQLFCDTCQRFLADRFVEGSCPHCNYDSARGDQCENCGKLLNPTELLDPKCKVCKSAPHIRDTDHLFLELPLLKDKLEAYINEMSVAGGWSQNAIQATNAWLREGLKPRCITRDLKWGVPVPHEKYKDKVFYVWFDAPIGYVSITACYTTEWEKWWKNPEEVELFQFMGKDNVPFHTVMFPSTLLGTGENWTLMKTISVTEYLNYESGKFSKSKGIGVFGNDAKDTNIPIEVWRYYLLTNRPEVSDALFTWDDLRAKLNNELLKNLGNFINRVLNFIAKAPGLGYGSILPDAQDAESHPSTKALGDKVGELVEQYVEAMEKVKLKQGLKIAMAISTEGNGYLQENEFWRLYKDDQPTCSIVMRTSAGLVYLIASLLEPFMPSFSIEVLKQLNLPLEQISLCDEKGDIERAKRPWEILSAGHRIGTPKPLFKELKEDEAELYRGKFSGSQADRADRKLKEEAEAKISEQLNKAKLSDGNAKKGKPKKSAQGASKTASLAEAEISVSRLDIRVGLIKKAEKHSSADSLYVEEIDVGEPQPRKVVSGLVKYIPLEKMQNRKVCVLCNLKPANMRGVKSEAMVLCASNSEDTKVELVEPPEGAVIGERVKFPGCEGSPDDQLNPKKKVWETVQPDLRTDEELVACYKGIPFTTSAGVCKVSSLNEAKIR